MNQDTKSDEKIAKSIENAVKNFDLHSKQNVGKNKELKENIEINSKLKLQLDKDNKTDEKIKNRVENEKSNFDQKLNLSINFKVIPQLDNKTSKCLKNLFSFTKD
jgi:hypothetical protein